jgi:hypothetical protein
MSWLERNGTESDLQVYRVGENQTHSSTSVLRFLEGDVGRSHTGHVRMNLGRRVRTRL